ncbi:serine/threonine-protein kinase [Nannocystis sp. SCPEA4]|uniref:serine/threonine protein kinase n=1 Tax=Nannocystis sp. SCPEA4 TaxID=2996787 RepID=UPI00226D4DDC|nr:serine/threonine-protein kinase [Nannocystis sp. SCPEA4]
MVMDPPMNLVGAVLEGRYQVVRLLGHGGMGSVFAGEDTKLKRRCALKVLHPRLAQDREHVERFLREAQMIASFDHPNIVDIYSYGEDPTGPVYFAMELLQGEDLDSRLRARAERPFGAHHCCLWALQIAEAVATVHDAGLIHRDLKVANVFLARRRDGEEVCKLLDFGIARAQESSDLTRTGITLGTPSYMSPEQVRNEPLDGRSDIYSFGVLLYKLLTGRVPFAGEPLQVAMAQCDTPPPPPSTLVSGISANLEAIVLTALAKRPDERFQTMRALATALREVLSEEAPELAAVLQRVTSVTVSVPLPSASALAARSTMVAAQDAPTPGRSSSQTGITAAQPPPPPTHRGLRVSAIVGASVLALLVGAVALQSAGKGTAPVEAASEVPQVPATAPAQEAPAGPGSPPESPAMLPSPQSPSPPERPAVQVAPVLPEVPPAQEVELPPLEPEVPAARSAADSPSRPSDPLRQLEREAKKCRRLHKAVGGRKVEVDYAVGSDGKVVRAVPATADALGNCLADAVRATRFEPKMALGRKVSL